MKALAIRLGRDRSGASAAEFALVLPLLILFLFGIVDAGRFAWEYNRAEKATQMGARMAVVTDPVAGGIMTKDFTGVSGLTAGDIIPAAAMPDITCNNSTCSCSGCPTGLPGTYNATAFTNLVTRMNQIDPRIAAANVQVIYRGSGLGYAGDPNGMDVVPIVTVQLRNIPFQPLTSLMLARVTMPDFHASLTAEDSVGTQAN